MERRQHTYQSLAISNSWMGIEASRKALARTYLSLGPERIYTLQTGAIDSGLRMTPNTSTQLAIPQAFPMKAVNP
jgi:hypothetical protein